MTPLRPCKSLVAPALPQSASGLVGLVLAAWAWLWSALMAVLRPPSVRRAAPPGGKEYRPEMASALAVELRRSPALLAAAEGAGTDADALAAALARAEGVKSGPWPALRHASRQLVAVASFRTGLEGPLAPFEAGNEEHEALLERLWEALRPGVRRAGGRLTDEWGEIGFQGRDPATDTRGGGVLGVRHLVSFAEGHPRSARAVLARTAARPNWFPLAITGINLTYDLVQLARAGRLDRYFYRHGAGHEQLEELYAAALVAFDAAWEAANPRDQMAFQSVRRPFLDRLARDVCDGRYDVLPALP